MHLMMRAQYQPDVYTRHKQFQRAIFLHEFFSKTQNILNVGTIKHGPAQVDNFIQTDIEM